MNRNKPGFTLVELAVVVVIIGVLAAFAVPRFLSSVERSKAADAFNYLSSVQAAQERYHARQGTYADDMAVLDNPEILHRRRDCRRRLGQPGGFLGVDPDARGSVGRVRSVYRWLHGRGLRSQQQYHRQSR